MKMTSPFRFALQLAALLVACYAVGYFSQQWFPSGWTP